MNRDCPHCGKHISWWRPLRSVPLARPGYRLAIPIAKCAFCGGLLANNPHPTEQWLGGTAELWALVFVAAWYFGGVAVGIVVSVLLVALAVAAMAYVNAKTKGWSRYAPYEGTEA